MANPIELGPVLEGKDVQEFGEMKSKSHVKKVVVIVATYLLMIIALILVSGLII